MDVEIGRLAVGLHRAAELRLWLLAHRQSAVNGSSGWCQVESLWMALHSLPSWSITRRHFRRLLRSGDDLFWHRHNDRLYLTGIARLGENLMIEAGLLGLESLIATNHPGAYKSVYIPLDHPHEAFEAQIYCAWLAAKRSKTLSRDLLEVLWRRSANTLRKWESDHLADRLTVTPNFALVSDKTTPIYAGGDYHPAVNSRVYQMVNTYRASARQHPRNGQRRKVQAAATGPYEALGADTSKRYFNSVKAALRAESRHSGQYVRYGFYISKRGSNYYLTTADIFLGL